MDRLATTPATNRSSATHNQHRNFTTALQLILEILATVEFSLEKSGVRYAE